MWKPAGRAITGTNDIPLGNKRRFGPAVIEDAPKAEIAQASPSSFPRTSAGQDESGHSPRSAAPSEPDLPRKRKSRWGDAKSEPVGLPTAISSSGVSQRELDNYAVKIRLDEINRKLQTNSFIPPERERSPSPPPTYDAHGRRTNTREVRYRKKLEEERVRLVDRAMKSDPNFRPPAEYHQQKKSLRPQDKVYIPVKEFPEINFFGLLVGPRGNSLKKMEKESGAKISIRGKGSVKEGKGRPDAFADDSEEDLHCLIMAESDDKVAACVALINKVIETAASTPEGQNDHKRNQLRELAALNGTLRDDENQICQNCVLVTASMTVPSNATTLPTSYVEHAATPDTWHATVSPVGVILMASGRPIHSVAQLRRSLRTTRRLRPATKRLIPNMLLLWRNLAREPGVASQVAGVFGGAMARHLCPEWIPTATCLPGADRRCGRHQQLTKATGHPMGVWGAGWIAMGVLLGRKPGINSTRQVQRAELVWIRPHMHSITSPWVIMLGKPAR
ncbi:hypothetical protein RSAG8_04754, partial [Rhizoctonia solani AG-8 WAC10335]